MFRQTNGTDSGGGADGVGEAQQGKVVLEAPAIEILMNDDLRDTPHHTAFLHSLREVVAPQPYLQQVLWQAGVVVVVRKREKEIVFVMQQEQVVFVRD